MSDSGALRRRRRRAPADAALAALSVGQQARADVDGKGEAAEQLALPARVRERGERVGGSLCASIGPL